METEFVVRLRVYAAAHFEWDEIVILRWRGVGVSTFRSEYTGGVDGRAYPVTLHAEIRGPGESLKEAERRLANSLTTALPILAVAANAAIADPLPVAAYGIPVSGPQPFVAYRTPAAESWFPPGRRRFELEATKALLVAVGEKSHHQLLLRAMESYRRAVGHFFDEEVLLAGEFLYIAAETLSRYLLAARAEEAGLAPRAFARSRRLGGTEELRLTYLEEIFGGDLQARRALEKASNGFEHGYASFDTVVVGFEAAIEPSFAHVRKALIEAAGPAPDARAVLLGPDYQEPRPLVPTIDFVEGELSATDPARAVPEFDVGALEIELEVGPQQVSVVEGEVRIAAERTVKVQSVPDNVSVALKGFGMRAANVKKVEADGGAVEGN